MYRTMDTNEATMTRRFSSPRLTVSCSKITGKLEEPRTREELPAGGHSRISLWTAFVCCCAAMRSRCFFVSLTVGTVVAFAPHPCTTPLAAIPFRKRPHGKPLFPVSCSMATSEESESAVEAVEAVEDVLSAEEAAAEAKAIEEALAWAKQREAEFRNNVGRQWPADHDETPEERQKRLAAEEAAAVARRDQKLAELEHTSTNDERANEATPEEDPLEWQRLLEQEEAEALERARKREMELQEQQELEVEDLWQRQLAEEEAEARARALTVNATSEVDAEEGESKADMWNRIIDEAAASAKQRAARQRVKELALRFAPVMMLSLWMVFLSTPTVTAPVNDVVANAFPALPHISISAELAAKMSAAAMSTRSALLLPLALVKLGLFKAFTLVTLGLCSLPAAATSAHNTLLWPLAPIKLGLFKTFALIKLGVCQILFRPVVAYFAALNRFIVSTFYM